MSGRPAAEAARLALVHAEELVTSQTREQGKPKPERQEELEWSANTLRYDAELTHNGRGRVLLVVSVRRD